MKITSLVFLFLNFTNMSFAEVKTEPFPIEEINNVSVINDEKIQIESHILYPNGCYKKNNTEGTIDYKNSRIQLSHYTDVKWGDFCTQALVSEKVIIHTPIPPEGIYKVIDSSDNVTLGTLLVDQNYVKFFDSHDDHHQF